MKTSVRYRVNFFYNFHFILIHDIFDILYKKNSKTSKYSSISKKKDFIEEIIKIHIYICIHICIL